MIFTYKTLPKQKLDNKEQMCVNDFDKTVCVCVCVCVGACMRACVCMCVKTKIAFL